LQSIASPSFATSAAANNEERRLVLFETLMFSLFIFFISVFGQLFLEISILLVDSRKSAIVYVEWYQWSRLIAFVDPLANPLLAIVRTPALRQKSKLHIVSIVDYFRNKQQSIFSYCFIKRSCPAASIIARPPTISTNAPDANSPPVIG
jgi:hypothetical protein